jgi:hypothetical protein
MASAQTNEDLPVPFGPRMMFSRGPGSISYAVAPAQAREGTKVNNSR